MTRFNKGKRIFIIAGEASGDNHGGYLAAELKKIAPEIVLEGVGGPRMKAAGVDILFNYGELAVTGLTEVAGRIVQIAGIFFKILARLRSNPPDLLIFIDYPDFNLMMARVAKLMGIKMLYYISPQIWAWRRGRVKSISRCIDRMIVILPFEEDFYRAEGVDVHFVGHPLVEMARPTMSRSEARAKYGLKKASTVIGLLPGSRRNEISANLPVMLNAARIISGKVPGVEFVIPVAQAIDPELIRRHIHPGDPPVKVLQDSFHDLVNICSLAIVSSGTATVEAALLEIPMIIIYKVSRLTYLAAKLVVNVNHIGLVNVVVGRQVVPELIQEQATAANIEREAVALLKDKQRLKEMKREFRSIKAQLGPPGAAARAAAKVIEIL
jgi:lipid-A-disaccharide synthase